MASKRKLRQKMCGDKVDYKSYSAAVDAAWHIKRKNGERLTPYGCRFCGGVHLGHPTASARQSMAQRSAQRRRTA